MTTGQSETIKGVLTNWEEEIEKEGRADVGSLLNASGSRAAGPLLFLPALVMISPIGAIPGVPIVLTTLTLLVAGQLVLGRTSIWLPSFVRNRGFPKQKVKSIIDKLTPYAERADRYLGQRLAMFAGETASRIIAAFCIFLSLLVYPATLLPFAVALPGSAILLLSLGLLVRDGVVALVGLMVALAAVATVVYWLA
ncbi:exopolysaccharide biosynthesis protein [Roseibium aggregatum]|uniref:exopolysaccharide biosynthesis protein n=1 Tax=Roseibium aggregatum TaxID=187304 RepID=UPI0025AC1D2D|nr:exopolysaccharide biosynthesis protein [Roseibium aggregatum]WJS04080.1 exopolysaccharide biosynthesis protein [Roseibium aggregatum]